jgi:hypothetical protein
MSVGYSSLRIVKSVRAAVHASFAPMTEKIKRRSVRRLAALQACRQAA